jgi:hypothetical protein
MRVERTSYMVRSLLLRAYLILLLEISSLLSLTGNGIELTMATKVPFAATKPARGLEPYTDFGAWVDQRLKDWGIVAHHEIIVTYEHDKERHRSSVTFNVVFNSDKDRFLYELNGGDTWLTNTYNEWSNDYGY